MVCGHLCTSFVPELHNPAPGPGETPLLFQRPFLRTVVSGRSAVALFFLITGYVNSIGPISRAKSGNTEDAFARISHSAFARSARLILPTMFATFFSWFVANVNGYRFIRHVDATWIRQGYYGPSPNLGAALASLIRYNMETWTTGWNPYDGTQWTVIMFIEAAMYVYLTMVSTMLITPKARRIVFAILYVYGWWSYKSRGAIKAMNVVIGMVVADMHVAFGDKATQMIPKFAPFVMLLVGVFLCNFPQNAAENAPWSNAMKIIMESITHKDSDIRRYWDSLGASTVFIAIFFSGPMRRVLTSKVFNFLGRVSFPVYLIHNLLIKTVLAWMVYFPSWMNPQFNENGEQMDLARPGKAHMAVAIMVFYYILYRVAYLWTCTIDPLIDRWIKAGTSWARGVPAQSQEKNQPILAS